MKSPNEKPSAAEFGILRSFLAQKGVGQAIINERVPAGAFSYMTRGEITVEMQAMCQEFPKAG